MDNVEVANCENKVRKIILTEELNNFPDIFFSFAAVAMRTRENRNIRFMDAFYWWETFALRCVELVIGLHFFI